MSGLALFGMVAETAHACAVFLGRVFEGKGVARLKPRMDAAQNRLLLSIGVHCNPLSLPIRREPPSAHSLAHPLEATAPEHGDKALESTF